MSEKLYKVKLHGFLEKQFSKDVTEVYGTTLKDIFSCLCHRFGEKFRRTILDGAWHITTGKRKSNKLKATDNFISEEMVDFPVNHEEIHIFPSISGAGAVGKIILGVVLIVVAAVLYYTGVGAALAPYLLTTGIGMVAGGAVEAIMGNGPKANYASAADKRQSFIYNGAINNTEQGVPVPLVYGRHLTGSTIISAALDVEQIHVY